MKAVAANRDSFTEIEMPTPSLASTDLLVRGAAVSVNPIDYKLRLAAESPRVLGFDAAGVVEQVGAAVKNFKIGDRVFYSGDMTRPGANSELHAVDERITGHMPKSLSFAEAAALPLTALTAWESLFERLAIGGSGGQLLIINGAGGVGSAAIQFAKRAGLHVIVSASRTESRDWCRQLGADQIVNHREPLTAQLPADSIDFILNCHDTDHYWHDCATLVKPQGKICALVSSRTPQNIELLKRKSAAFVWEFMSTKTLFKTADMAEQGKILEQISSLADAGKIRSTLTTTLNGITPENLRQAHLLLEDRKSVV